MSVEYLLVRDADESERLILQHDLWIRNFGYRIHPSILNNLTKSGAYIADIGCGTGIWLIDLSYKTNNIAWKFEGFDISSEQFPHHSKASATATVRATAEARAATAVSMGNTVKGEDLSILPDNVDLHVHDMRRPFPAEYLGRYDLIHARLMVLCVEVHEWNSIVSNMRTLLKPGGWLQIEEIDIAPNWSVLRSQPLPPDGGLPFLHRGTHHLLSLVGHRCSNVHHYMLEACQKAGLKNIHDDVVSSDRIPELRYEAARLQMLVLKHVCRQQLAVGKSGSWSADEIDRVVQGMEMELNQGAYVNYYLHCVIGQA